MLYLLGGRGGGVPSSSLLVTIYLCCVWTSAFTKQQYFLHWHGRQGLIWLPEGSSRKLKYHYLSNWMPSSLASEEEKRDTRADGGIFHLALLVIKLSLFEIQLLAVFYVTLTMQVKIRHNEHINFFFLFFSFCNIELGCYRCALPEGIWFTTICHSWVTFTYCNNLHTSRINQ